MKDNSEQIADQLLAKALKKDKEGTKKHLALAAQCKEEEEEEPEDFDLWGGDE